MLHKEIMKWARSKDVPEREDLERMYRAVIAPNCNPMVLMTMSNASLIKAICRGEYYRTIDVVHKWKVVYFLALCFGMKDRAISHWLPKRAYKYVNIRKIDKDGGVISFPNIPAASKATGIMDDAIYKAIARGGTTSQHRFEADLFKPVLNQ